MRAERVGECVWDIPPSEKPGMLVPARIFASEVLFRQLDQGVFEQITNVACLPGIVGRALCMPDGHWGYGFPIGGVAAFRTDTGVISPGGIGFDINCGIRLVRTTLTEDEVRPRLGELMEALFRAVPAGVGARGFVSLSEDEFAVVMQQGAGWCVRQGLGWPEDLEHIEGRGRLVGADPAAVSERAVARGHAQLGTLGSGNHYLEVQALRPEGLHDAALARAFGITGPGQIFVMLHCGSRGFGHQIATDYVRAFGPVLKRHGIAVRDRELACAPFRSPEGQAYFRAMNAAANAAFANRQVITHRVREVFGALFRRDPRALDLGVVYDVCHNTAKVERHRVDGVEQELLVHRKGATRAFGPGAPDVPADYRATGQPVLLGGSMETGSTLLVGTQAAMEETFGSTAHGAGRTMSRHQAKRQIQGGKLLRSMAARGIVVRAVSEAGVAEEAGFAYKDLGAVVDVLARTGISRPVATFTPIGNIKG
jgi:tRNA-splicing ligase RtcB